MKGIWILSSVWLVIVGLGSAAPVPTFKPLTAERRLIEEVALPPMGLIGQSKVGVFVPRVSKELSSYPDKQPGQPKLREKIREAQILLWATSGAKAPLSMQREVARLQERIQPPAVILELRLEIDKGREGEQQLLRSLLEGSKSIARVTIRLEAALEDLESRRKEAEKESPRWQANYDLMRLGLRTRIAALEELNYSFGWMRVDLPFDAKKARELRFVPGEKLRDSTVKRAIATATKLAEQIEIVYPETVWSQMAQCLRQTNLSVGWEMKE
jgi:hypothetical protein